MLFLKLLKFCYYVVLYFRELVSYCLGYLVLEMALPSLCKTIIAVICIISFNNNVICDRFFSDATVIICLQ